jgi:hypothetical protein
VTAWHVFMAVLSLGLVAAVSWPSLSGFFARVLAYVRGGVSTVTPSGGSKVTAEQAQSAVLTIARFLAGGHDDPAYRLIVNDVQTLDPEKPA